MERKYNKAIPTDQLIGQFLLNGRQRGLSYLKKQFPVFSDDDVEDVFSNAEIALFEKIHKGEMKIEEDTVKVMKDGHLENLMCSLSTYFISLCYNQGLKFLRSLGKNVSLDEAKERIMEDSYSTSKMNELLELGDDGGLSSDQKQVMREIVKDLPHPCEEILWSYYADEMSTQEISDMLNYSGSRTVITTKSRCMSKLKERFERIMVEFYDTRS